MSDTNRNEAQIYQIRLKGSLTPQWADWFDGFIISQTDGYTQLTGSVVDQSALHGLLKKVRDLGLPLVSVNPIPSGTEANSPQNKLSKGGKSDI